MVINPTQLRANLYKILDEVVETKQPIQIIRQGKILEISIKETTYKGKLANLTPHKGTISGDPEHLVHLDWSTYWQGNENL